MSSSWPGRGRGCNAGVAASGRVSLRSTSGTAYRRMYICPRHGALRWRGGCARACTRGSGRDRGAECRRLEASRPWHGRRRCPSPRTSPASRIWGRDRGRRTRRMDRCWHRASRAIPAWRLERREAAETVRLQWGADSAIVQVVGKTLLNFAEGMEKQQQDRQSQTPSGLRANPIQVELANTVDVTWTTAPQYSRATVSERNT